MAKPRKKKDSGTAAAVWKERELLDGKLVDAGVVILRTTGCSHFHEGACSMCGYNIESSIDIKPEDIRKQFDKAVATLGDIRFLKVYTSGSFLDQREIPREIVNHILQHCKKMGWRLLFESRPEYVTDARLDEVKGIHEDLEIALGLESANDRVLAYSINKGFTVANYVRAAEAIEGHGAATRTYVLLKPPFLTEWEAVKDAAATIRFAATKSATVSLNPVNIQRGTLVEKLWRNWAYRPPWLWSVLDVMRSTKDDCAKLICDPTGGGSERGAHNCGECDGVILDSIRAFSTSQDASKLGSPDCKCKDIWRTIIDVEGFVSGGTVDLQRFFRPQRT
ncbi:MAG: TIGR01210 family radical SAM protein [Euryarchaeota archaeon RBG_13_57_23]|nr:MAG: TIGR01210 family radical SAM protein [Euryarchaeota archaeon RBG_13_57_23]